MVFSYIQSQIVEGDIWASGVEMIEEVYGLSVTADEENILITAICLRPCALFPAQICSIT